MNINQGHEREKKLTQKDYQTEEYFSYEQLWSFAEQIYHIKKMNPTNILEIGIGNGFVSTFFKRIGVEVTTVDINENLKPDIVLAVEEIGKYFADSTFELISCCEVLEHLPFEHFENIIKDFAKISNKLFLTLPMHGRIYGFGGYIQFPHYYKWIGKWVVLKKESKLPDAHYWEINHSSKLTKKVIINILSKYFNSVETDLFKAHPTHRYFLCSN